MKPKSLLINPAGLWRGMVLFRDCVPPQNLNPRPQILIIKLDILNFRSQTLQQTKSYFLSLLSPTHPTTEFSKVAGVPVRSQRCSWAEAGTWNPSASKGSLESPFSRIRSRRVPV